MPADAATLTLLGNAYMADRKPALALQQFQAAAALDPENLKIKAGVAISEIDAGQTEQGLPSSSSFSPAKPAPLSSDPPSC